ncbi:Uncharacterised protein [Vibrio cholerae]|nr:Uncharacterised protein [Vibrio cholerae]
MPIALMRCWVPWWAADYCWWLANRLRSTIVRESG